MFNVICTVCRASYTLPLMPAGYPPGEESPCLHTYGDVQLAVNHPLLLGQGEAYELQVALALAVKEWEKMGEQDRAERLRQLRQRIIDAV